jgi:hypothetical protein
MAVSKTIYPSNAYVVRQQLRKYDPTVNEYVLWTGATSVAVGFYEDALGTVPINGLTNLAMAQSAVLGTYYAVIGGSTLAPLIPYSGQTVYQIVTAGPLSDLKVVTPLVVTLPRYAQ